MTSTLPRWDLSSAYPALDSPAFEAAFEDLSGRIQSLDALLSGAERLAHDSADLVGTYERVVSDLNDLQRHSRTMGAFIEGYVSVDSRDELALARESELEIALVPLSKLLTRFTAWIGSLPQESLLARSEVARDHRYMLEKAAVAAKHLMTPEEEALAHDLNAMALSAWSRLHGIVTSQIEIDLEARGHVETLPMSGLRNLAYDPDRDVRRAAYEAELATWKRFDVPLAAAMNSIKGTVNTLSRRRRWKAPLDEALFNANIDRETLDAMMDAAREAFPDFRRYLRAKARALGLSRLAFYDIFAPVGSSSISWSYEAASEFVAKHFRSYSDKMGDFAERSYRERWIDAEARPGKTDGAFCMWFVADESRVLMNYKTSFGSVKTLAHELGHAYHNLCLSGRTMLQRRTPMTLAETASIFCETIIQNAALQELEPADQLPILEGSLQGACQVTVDIASRFLFEQSVFDGREHRELAASELCAHMLDAQRQTYGDGLDADFLHPYMWAAKGHYYSGRSFYNFPYMFGMLFGLGLYARYLEDRESFKGRYDDLLSSTGLAGAASLAARFGIDVKSIGFWRSSFDVIRSQVDRFESLV